MLFNYSKIERFTDDELLEKYRKTGKKKYVGVLFQRYSHLVFGVSMKYLKNQEESKDAVLQIFEKLLQDLKTQNISNFKPWLHTVTRNHCLMFLRKQKSISLKQEQYEYTETAQEEGVTEGKEEGIIALEKALEKLKPEQRECVELFYLKEKCYQEVAELTGFDLKQVKSYIQNGKRNLKLSLQNNAPLS